MVIINIWLISQVYTLIIMNISQLRSKISMLMFMFKILSEFIILWCFVWFIMWDLID